jgi:hypothetical protein
VAAQLVASQEGLSSMRLVLVSPTITNAPWSFPADRGTEGSQKFTYEDTINPTKYIYLPIALELWLFTSEEQIVPEMKEIFLVTMEWDVTDASNQSIAFIFRVEEQEKQKTITSCFSFVSYVANSYTLKTEAVSSSQEHEFIPDYTALNLGR